MQFGGQFEVNNFQPRFLMTTMWDSDPNHHFKQSFLCEIAKDGTKCHLVFSQKI